MRTLAGRDAHVHFTHLSKTSCQSLAATFQTSTLDQRGSDLVEASCHEYGVLDLIKDNTGTGRERVCLLDPKAEQELSPEDGDGRFEYFLFGVRCS
jgi:ribosome biogenesis SPOUT family RNA methylase Rps3